MILIIAWTRENHSGATSFIHKLFSMRSLVNFFAEILADCCICCQCGICLMMVKVWEQPNVKISCGHNFCTLCWESYLSSKILEGMHHDILCPAYQCPILVPLDVIERLVSPDLTRRYLHFDIKVSVTTKISRK